MKTTKVIVCTLIILLSLSSLVGLFLPTNAEETWTDITTLPYTITESGNYRITAPYNSSGALLEINASNVVLDGQNYLLQQTRNTSDRTIIINENCSNVLIKNINQTNAYIALEAFSGNFTIQDCAFLNNSDVGILVFNVTDFNIQRCNLTNTYNGFYGLFASNYTLTDSILDNNRYGAWVYKNGNITIDNCSFNNNSRSGFDSEASGDITIRNSAFSNNDRAGFDCLYGNFTISNSTLNNNGRGIMAGLCDSVVISNATINENVYGIITELCNSTIQDSILHFNGEFAIGAYACNTTRIINCDIQKSYWTGILSETCNSTIISNSTLIDNEMGILAVDYYYYGEYTNCSEFIVENSLIQNSSYYGLGNQGLNNLTVRNTTFNYNGLRADRSGLVNGALVSIDSNCTITDNTFFNNSYAFLWDAFGEDVTSNQLYTNNNFQNNTYTMLIGYYENATNQQFNFYNNLVNDTAYIHPLTFTSYLYDDDTPAYAPPSTVFNLNTTMQAGVRINSMGSMIGGNYWAHPNGTGPSEIGIDADNDGFIDTPVELFGNATYGTAYDYLAYSNNNSVSISFVDGEIQQLTTSQVSDVITVELHDLYGPVISGATVNLASSATTGRFYSASTCTNQITSVTIPANASTASFYYKDSARGTPTIIVSGQNMTTATTIFRVLTGQTSSSTSTPTPTTSPTATPTPTETIQALKEDNTNTTIPIVGNISASQFSNITITNNQTAITTTLSFTLTGETGTQGFCNMTIPKSQVPYGTTLVVYIDGQPAPNQGFTQDNQNYYVWFTTSFSTHNLVLEFVGQTSAEPQADLTLTYVAIVAAIIAVIIVAVLVNSRRKK